MNFQIETHNFCNFTCGYCPNKDMERKREFMSDEVWNMILNKYVTPYKEKNQFCPPTLILHKDSEPLIDRGLPDKLLTIAALVPDMKVDIYSNGVLLPKLPYKLFDLMQSLPNRFRYLMSYHPYNHDGSKNDYRTTIEYMKGVLSNAPPNVEFITTSHRSKHVTPEMQEEWLNQWIGFPITVHSNCSINPWTGRIDEGEVTAHFDGCPYGDFGHMFFGCTGNVIACCLDLEEEIVFGNVLTDDPAEVIADLEAFYSEQRAGNWKHAVCANCYGKKREDLVQLGRMRNARRR